LASVPFGFILVRVRVQEKGLIIKQIIRNIFPSGHGIDVSGSNPRAVKFLLPRVLKRWGSDT